MTKQAGWKKAALLIPALFWCAYLVNSDSRFEPYLLVAAAGLLCWADNQSEPVPERKIDGILGAILSGLLSACVSLANYKLFPEAFSSVYGIVLFLLVLAGMLWGGYVLFRQIFRWIYRKALCMDREVGNASGKWVFFGAAGSIFAVDSFFLFGCLYPGILSTDSIIQLQQIFSGVYNSHHPYYHTALIRFWLRLGEGLFGNVNAGVAAYSLFSVFLVSVCFGYVVHTVYWYTGSKPLTAGVLGWYLLMPFHIMYSVTMWKDVPFGAMAGLFTAGMFRLLMGGKKRRKTDWAAALVGAFGLCLLRSNGWMAVAVSFAVFLLLFGKREKKLAVMLAAVLAGSFVLNQPVLNAMGINKSDPVESLSIPLQQVGRAIAHGAELTEEEYALLDQVMDASAIADTYKSWISDPLKFLVWNKNNQSFFLEHKLEFAKLYLRLGMKHPMQYVQAWVEQTKGYWNGGYAHWVWEDGVGSNDYGITGVVRSNGINDFLQSYLSLFDLPLLQAFLCIGLYSWVLLFAIYGALVKRSREALFLSVFPAAVILTLLIAAPVYSEFRYVYSVVCAMPMLLTASFWPGKRKERDRRENP